MTSCLAIGLFYVLTTYAGDVYFGPDKFVTFGQLNGGSPWIGLARDVWGVGWVVVFLAILELDVRERERGHAGHHADLVRHGPGRGAAPAAGRDPPRGTGHRTSG